ncbi:hemophore-related protein [Mycobacterium sp. CVI_P3]|uniref:Hemophore-related protein n=1 Tax=Mycobacterium pinniadriaticum TaxID=2994102 RepID=A0ABT3SLX4_9MYCO|nr:hemophore-related protein [Mycobacterium pinniadriaticum]MCX2934111.1 hemophore-related protein [Mycobacterium pinniadriaticum]MCX2940533.1 hemophore-related protein [Mycobacterium pinniadriaticum]
MKSAKCLRSVVVVGSVTAVFSVLVGGTASADPIMDALANTPCSYSQVTAALDAQAPALAAQLNHRPDMQTNLQQFLALPVDQRQQQLAQQQAANPQLQAILAAQIGPQVVQVANTCMNY